MTRKERYDDRRARGRCVDCGAKAAPRRIRCKRCCRKSSRAARAYQERNREQYLLMHAHKRWSLKLSNPGLLDESRARYERKVNNGMCVDCPRVAEDGGRYCERCHKRRIVSWRRYRRKKRREERAAVRAYVPLDQVIDLTRVRILRAARDLDWFSTHEINCEMGASDARVRNAVTQMLRRLAKAGVLERRTATDAIGGKYEYRISESGRAELTDVLGGRRRPCLAGRRTKWAA